MSSIRSLIQLQEVDTALSVCRTQLAEIQRRLDDTVLIDDLKAQRDTLKHLVAAAERDARSAEADAQDARSHLGEVEGKLYGGAVSNPKELMSLQQDADMVRGQLNKLEAASLAAMASLEQQQKNLAAVEQQLAVAVKEHKELAAVLNAQKGALEGEVATLDTRRSAVTERVPPGDLKLYASMFGARQGRAVARVERTLCHGCRVTLPAVVVQRVRTSPNLVQCPSCGRILYAD